MRLCTGIRRLQNTFRKTKGLEHRVQDLHFQRKQIKFRLHCTISI